ncbi:hypothetical protein D3C84_306510 [compost metagenome]
MIEIHNHSGLLHACCIKHNPNGYPFHSLVIRGTFDFAASGQRMPLSAEQTPIDYADTFAGPVESDPRRAILQREGDLVFLKRRTDIHLLGHLYSLEQQPRQSWIAGLRLGPIDKRLRVTGPRKLKKGLLLWKLSEAQPVTQVPLDYRLAFGGCFDDPEPPQDSAPEQIIYPRNPSGCGWLPENRALKHLDKKVRQRIQAQIDSLRELPAPQFEELERPIDQPWTAYMPQGFGPIARWWQPRLGLQGSYGPDWLRERYPRLPEDFDPLYYQSAHPDLIAPRILLGHEELALSGCLPEGRVEMRLPGVQPILVAEGQQFGKTIKTPGLDTIRLDLDQRRCTLLWRIVFNAENAPEQIGIALSRPNDSQWQDIEQIVGSRV